MRHCDRTNKLVQRERREARDEARMIVAELHRALEHHHHRQPTAGRAMTAVAQINASE